MQGWISLYRDLQDSFLWNDKEPFDKRSAWVDMLLLANYENEKTIYRGEEIECKRGDVNLSVDNLSKRWKWSRHKTSDYLDELENNGFIIQKRTKRRTVIHIVGYDERQTKGHQKDIRIDAKKDIRKNAEKPCNYKALQHYDNNQKDIRMSANWDITNKELYLNNTVNNKRITDEDRKRFEEIDNWIDQERKNGDVFLNAIFR